LWDDFTQEEIREGSQSSGQKGDGVDEENFALVAKGKEKKKRNFERDLNKVRCYCCNQLGHLASQCLEKKKEQVGPDTTTMEDFSSKFDKDFSLVTLVSSVSSGGFGGDNRWIVDSGASCHVTRIWRVFLIITKTSPDRLVESEGDMACVVHGVGRVRL
jgi:hypothetical protein